MPPSETRLMLDGVVSDLGPAYENRKAKALRELKIKMMGQGLGKSSAFDRGITQIFFDSFDEYVRLVLGEVKRVLEETRVAVYPGCEQDLVQFLNGALALVYEADRKHFDDQKHLTSNTARPHFQAGFEFRYKHATKKIATEVKILCAKLQAAKSENIEAATQPKSFVQWAGDDRVTLAIVFTEIVGSVAIGEALKDQRMDEVRRAHFAQSRKLIAQFNGHEIKTVGDSFMVAFRSVEKAFDFAHALQADTRHAQVQVRAGIHIGPMRVEEGDLFGDTVNFAARVVGVSKGAEIWLSNRAKEDIDSLGADHHRQLKWERHDGIALKGFQGTFALWSLAQKHAAD